MIRFRLSLLAFAAMTAAGQGVVSPNLVDIIFPGVPSPVLYGMGGAPGPYFPLRSADSGQSWVPLYVFPAGGIQDITGMAVDPVDPRIVYVTAQMNRGGVLKSTDGGQTWTQRSAGLPVGNASVVNLTVAANNPNVLYARVADRLFKSTDGAANWTALGNLPEATGKLALLATTPTQAYFRGPRGAVFRSTDDGKTWDRRARITFPDLPADVDPLANLGDCLTIDPSNPNIVYVCIQYRPGELFFPNMPGIWRSEDGGATWTKLWQPKSPGPGAIVDPRDGMTVHLSYEGAPCYVRSSNRGVAFTIVGSTFCPSFLDPRTPTVIYGTRNPNSEVRFVSKDGGNTWSDMNASFKPTFATVTTPVTVTLQVDQAATLPVPANTAESLRSAVALFATKSAAPWLSIPNPTSTSFTGLSLRLSAVGLAPGTYDATITLTSAQTMSPGTIPVRLVVVPALSGPTYTITTVAGEGTATTESPDGVSAVTATLGFNGPVAVDALGDVYFVSGYRVRKVDASGILRAVAGTGTRYVSGPNGDGGTAINAAFGTINGLAIDKQGRVYISDTANNRLRVVENGIVRTLLGSSDRAQGIDFRGPRGLDFAPNGDLYITAQPGVFRLPAGQSGLELTYQFANNLIPRDVAVTADGTLYLLFGSKAYRWKAGSTLTAIAGSGTAGFNGDGLATNVHLNNPSALKVDADGNVWIADDGNNLIRVLGTDGNLRTVAGGGTSFLGSNIGATASSFLLTSESDLAFGPQGVIVFSEGTRIRRLAKDATPRPFTVAGSFVNAGSNLANLSPGALFSFYGKNMATSTAVASGSPWPTTLGGATVRINGTPVPLFYASPTQINGQVPINATINAFSDATVTVNALASAAVRFRVSDASPGILVFGANRAVVVNQNGAINTADTPAKPGEILVGYFTGIGLADNAVATGVAAPDAPLSRPVLPVKISVGATPCRVLFVGLTPGFIGLAQANFELPALPPGDAPLTIEIGEQTSNSPLLSVAP